MRKLSTLLLLTFALPGCGPGTVHIATGCERLDLDEGSCLLPWPSSHFQDDATHVITLPDDEMPVNAMGAAVSPDAWNGRDGYSAMTSIVTRVSGAIDTSTLASWRAPETTTHGVTVLIDVTTGLAVPHFAEIQEDTLIGDGTPDPVDRSFTTLYLRPAARLEEGHHYVVGILVRRADEARSQPPSSTAFAALRDRTPTDSPLFESRRQHFEDEVFAPLATAGVDRARLVVAWDFWTGSGQDAWGDLVAMRDEARDMTLGCDITVPAVAGADPIAFRIEGEISVPYFLDVDRPASAALASAGIPATARLARSGGVPTAMGHTIRARFIAVVPQSVAHGAAPTPVRLVEYGHGLFNAADEIEMHHIGMVLDESHAIGIATDAYGLSGPADVGDAAQALLDLSLFSALADHVLQGVIAQVVLPHVFATSCGPTLTLPNGATIEIDPDHFGWLGNSQGGIMGPTIAALEPRFDRLALGVGGISYPIMLPRSCDWPGMLAGVLQGGYPSHIDRDLLMVMFASHWDRFEGATFAPHLANVTGPLGAPSRAILVQIAKDDLGTPEVSGEIAARTMHLSRLACSATTPWGIDTLDATATPTSAFVSYEYDGFPVAPEGTATPPLDACAESDPCLIVHERVRRDPRAQTQIAQFFQTGTITDTCMGRCGGPASCTAD